jgi:2-polyprenyl-6-methoxyphenol hydroxylase-like FAD-dependent oxidoreductase
MYDAIIVGARCAGSPTAMLLARKGYRVLLLDKAGFPSDTLSTHYIHQPGVARLKRWGLLDQVIASNCPPVRRQRLDLGPFALVGEPPPADGVADGYGPRRTVLDKILVDGAVAAGAELREHFSVQELCTDGERVTGIRGHTIGGAMVTERARVVIGADGLRSLVARQVQAHTYHVRPTYTCAFYAYWSDVPLEGAELYPRPGRMITAAPTNDGQTLIIVLWPNAAFQEIRADIEGNFLKSLELAPGLAERVRNGQRSERFRGTADIPNFFRQASGPGWALVGDAGYHKDPILAQGISDAFRDAELLTAALDDGLSGRQSLEEALADYGRQRDVQAMPGFEMSCQFAMLEPPSPDMQQLFAALVGNQEQINRFFGSFIGTVPAAEFYSPENVGQIVSGVPMEMESAG